ncbi:protein phosphatase CheZ [Tepidicaulis sp. LMO-SS28]|uniref:protein phosphatase CheZ n=1 Tax=Tepidicaulis sp. LMO-SS28 TaxID=3447455 RepID=UPI003EE35A05
MPEGVKTAAASISADEEFDAVEQAILETPRGRWFLKEYTRRNRQADTRDLVNAIEKLGRAAFVSSEQAHLDVLRRELQEMSASIQHTRAEIAAIKPEDAGDNRIMAATEELDAIITATERATSDILGAAERLQEIGERLREQGADEELCEEIESHATGIFMACSFQDITGQRTTKVVNVLRYLEQRVNAMIQIWGISGQDSLSAPDLKDMDKRPDAHLLNGPQSEGKGVDQADIDAMMSGNIAELEAKIDAVASAIEEKAPAPAKSAPAPAPKAEADAAPASSEPIDQSDIDALFD